ncbi:MAG: toxin-antitoxin system YwqK family antitoxin [Bacteroidia bacterium]
MKQILLIFFILYTYYTICAQDTTELFKFNDGTKSFKLITKTDTSLIYKYPSGKRESVRKVKNNQITGTYSRYYENGNIMWKKELKNGIQDGKAEFFNEKGVKVAELIYKNNFITDTVFFKEHTHLILGKIRYSSTVYGGMQREDGSSNVSECSGPFLNYSMNAIKVDSIMKPQVVSKFKSDFNGDFSIVVPEGKIGFCPKNIKIEFLESGELSFINKLPNSPQEGWSMKKPLIIYQDSKIIFVELHHSSVGFAP